MKSPSNVLSYKPCGAFISAPVSTQRRMRTTLKLLLLLALISGPPLAMSQSRSLAGEASESRVTLASREAGTSLAVDLPLFIDVGSITLKLKIERLGVSGQGRQTLIAGNRSGRLQLVSEGGATWLGRLTVEGVAYRVTGNLEALTAEELPARRATADSPRVSRRGEPVSVKSLRAQAPSTAAPTILDLLVIREAGVDPVFVDLAVLLANDAFYLSDVPVQVRIHATETLEDMQGGLGDILENAYWGRDEFATIPPAFAYGADAAAIFVEGDPDEDSCGIAYLGAFRVDSQLYLDAYLYSVTNTDETGCSQDTLAHEIGHNMGADHDRENTDEDTPDYIAFPFAYGYRSGAFGTIMSYAPFIDPFSTPTPTSTAVARSVMSPVGFLRTWNNPQTCRRSSSCSRRCLPPLVIHWNPVQPSG